MHSKATMGVPLIRTAFRGLTALGLGLAFACQGTIGDPVGLNDPNMRPTAEACDDIDRDPGYVTLHRLNRIEYDNTIRDLLGDTRQLATTNETAFPVDNESADGFINDADILTVGVLALEKYDAAARDLAAAAVERESFQSEFLSCDPASSSEAACAREFVESFGRRAWRRPLESAEIDQLTTLITDAADETHFENGLENGIRAILLSPNFMFRAETHGSGVRDLNGHELASRLSYFLWATMPDPELDELADDGSLTQDDVLRSQVERMMADSRFEGFVNEFAARWLRVSTLPEYAPDGELYPEFDEELRQAFDAETRMFVQHILENDLPLTDLLTADFTFLNERLANHYGIEGVTGDEMQLVRLDAENVRGGLLTQGAILGVTSHPNRTSPVTRGKFVLERFLCTPPPDPPADVDTLLDDEGPDGALSVRQRLERHQEIAECATCHATMDPIGFALENFNVTGAWRTTDEGFDIDATGELPDGQFFDGPSELGQVLANDPRFATCVGEKLTAYALGRTLRSADYCTVDDLVNTAGAGLTLRGLIIELVTNDVFRKVGQEGGGR